MPDMPANDVKRGGPSVNPFGPASAQRTPGQRALMFLVIFLGVLLVAGVAAVVIGLAVELRHPPAARPPAAAPESAATAPEPAAAAEAESWALPAGARIEAMQLSGDRLVLRVATAAGEEVDIVDTANGRLIRRIAAAPAAH